MADLSKYSDEELEAMLSSPKRPPPPTGKDLSKYSTEELMNMMGPPPQKKGPIEYGVSLVTDPLKKAGAAIAAPIVAASEALDPYTGAPVRAAVGAAQRGGGLADIGGAFSSQMKAGEVLPSTPSGEEVVFTEQRRLGIPKEFAKKSSEVLGPVAGSVMDVTNFIPAGSLKTGANLTVKFSSKAMAGAKAVGRVAEKGGDLATRALMKGGEAITLGNLQADKAIKAAKNLTGSELLFPGNIKFGPTKKAAEEVGRIRKSLQENPVVVPGSRDALMGVRSVIKEAEGRTIAHPQSKAILDLIETKLQPKMVKKDLGGLTREVEEFEDLTLDEIDDVIGNLDISTFTAQGNQKSLNRMWGPALKKSRFELDKVLQTVPEGQLFKEAKSRFEDLATAGKQRSKLIESVSMAGFVGGVFNPTALALRFLSPTTYMQIVGAAKLPKEAAEGVVSLLSRAKNTNSAEAIRDALVFVAKDHPDAAERIIRGAFLASGKEDDLPKEEEENLAKNGLSIPGKNQGLSIPRSR